MIKSLHILMGLAFVGFLVVFPILVWKWTNDINKVLVPEHISLDTAKYTILKQDSMTIEGMRIKRVYYLERKK